MKTLNPFDYILAAILLVGAFIVLPWSFNAWNAHPAPQSVLGISSIPWTQIDDILCKAKSPACGTGQTLSNEGWNNDIDASFALAVFHEGSNYGKLACNPTPACITFKGTWAQSYATWYATIKTQYVKHGITTIPAILSAMAPPNETQYAQAVNTSMSTWRA